MPREQIYRRHACVVLTSSSDDTPTPRTLTKRDAANNGRLPGIDQVDSSGGTCLFVVTITSNNSNTPLSTKMENVL